MSALVVAGVLAVVGAALFVRFPLVVPVALAVAAPFRVPVTLGGQEAFLLVPLYGVLAAAGLAFVYRLLRGEEAVALPRPLAAAAAAFIAPELRLAALVARRRERLRAAPVLPPAVRDAGRDRRAHADRGLAATRARGRRRRARVRLRRDRALAGGDAAGLLRPDLEVANAYSTFFRVTSLFRDPSLYGRFLVVAIVVLLTALWLERVRLAVALPVIALLFAGLFFSYSQSSFATLFVMTAAVTFVLSDRRTRIVVAAACAVLALIAAGVVAWSATEVSLRELTSGRSRLVSITLPLAREHPLAGVGVGAQPLATNERLGLDPETRRTASHTTPATVAAELGALGVVAYVAFLAAGPHAPRRGPARARLRTRPERRVRDDLRPLPSSTPVSSRIRSCGARSRSRRRPERPPGAPCRQSSRPGRSHGRRRCRWQTDRRGDLVKRKLLIALGLVVLLAAGAAVRRTCA